MAGLLDFFDNGDAQLGLGLLAAAAPRADGAGFGTRLLEGVQQGQQWKQQQKKNKLMDLQQQEVELKLAEAQRAADIQKWTQENAPKFFRPSVPAQPAQFQDVPQVPQAAPAIANPMGQDPAQTRQMPPVQQLVSPAVKASPASFDQRGFIESYAQKDPLGALPFLTKDSKPITLKQDEVLVDPTTYKTLFTAPSKPEKIDYNKPFLPDGTPNTAYQEFSIKDRKAGASNQTVINEGQKGLDNTLKVRSDFRSEPIYKAYGEVQSAHSQITQSLKQASPAGDLAGATKLMKILDPGSVVRESELGMAMAASGLLDRAVNYADMVIKGTKLTPAQRKDFQTLSGTLLNESAKQYGAKRAEYAGIAKRNNLSEADILGPEPVINQPKPNQLDSLPSPVENKGRTIRDTTTGKLLRSNGMQWVESK
jgi:hypothetical protein